MEARDCHKCARHRQHQSSQRRRILTALSVIFELGASQVEALADRRFDAVEQALRSGSVGAFGSKSWVLHAVRLPCPADPRSFHEVVLQRWSTASEPPVLDRSREKARWRSRLGGPPNSAASDEIAPVATTSAHSRQQQKRQRYSNAPSAGFDYKAGRGRGQLRQTRSGSSRLPVVKPSKSRGDTDVWIQVCLSWEMDTNGVLGLRDELYRFKDQLNSLHCAMCLNRISKVAPQEQRLILQDPIIAHLRERVIPTLPRARTRDVAMMSNSLSKMRSLLDLKAWQPVITALHVKAAALWSIMGPMELAMIINAFANLSPRPPLEIWPPYITAFLTCLDRFDPQGLAMVVNGFSKLFYHPGADVLRACESRALELMPTFGTQELANVVNGLAKFADFQASAPFLTAWEKVSQPLLERFRPEELAMALNAMGKFGHRPSDAFLTLFEQAAIQHMPRFKPQESAIIVNAFTKMENYLPSATFWTSFETYVIREIPRHKAQEIANSLHGMGKLGHQPSKEFLNLMVQQAVSLIAKHGDRGFKAQEVANTLNGLSKMDYAPPSEFFDAIIATSKGRLHQFDSQELANMVNGLMRLAWKPDEEFLIATANNALPRLQKFKEQELAQVMHGYGRFLFFPGGEFMSKFETCWLDKATILNAQALIMILSAFARLSWKPGQRIMEVMETGLEKTTREGQLLGAEVGQALNGMANLCYMPKREYLAALKAAMLEQQQYLDLSTVAVTLWSLSALDVPRMKTFLTEMIDLACRRLSGEAPKPPPATWTRASMFYSAFDEAVPDEAMEPPLVMCVRQLMQTSRYLTTLKNPIEKGLQRRFTELLQSKWKEVQVERHDVRTSRFHQSVLDTARHSLGLHCDVEVEDEAYTIDIVIYPPAGQGPLPIVVEADGPHHFFRNAPWEPMGFTKFKHRLLESRADRWQAVVSVPQMDWKRAYEEKGERGRVVLLLSKLLEAGWRLEHLPEIIRADARRLKQEEGKKPIKWQVKRLKGRIRWERANTAGPSEPSPPSQSSL